MFARARNTALIFSLLGLLLPALLFSAQAGLSLSEHPGEESWTSKAPMLEARSDLGTAVVSGKVYTIGDFIREYDPATNMWAPKTRMPTLRWWLGVAVFQNKIYCIGGANVSVATGYVATGANEVYDPATDTWENKAPMPTPRFKLRANVVDGKIYLIGGINSDIPEDLTIPHRLNYGQRITDVVEVYDPVRDTWTNGTSMPSATAHYASAVIKNKMYFITPTLNQIYDAESDSWSRGAPPVSPDCGSGGVTSGVFAPQRIFVFGQNVTQSYDPTIDSWTTYSHMPTSRYNTGVAVVDDKFYVMGGLIDIPATLTFGVNKFYPVESAVNEEYTPVGYGTIPPDIVILSPENRSYGSSTVSLNFTLKFADWIGYSLDGQENVSVTRNTTLADLPNGQHNVTVYANDTYGNMGASQATTFTINKPAPFPTTETAAATIVIGSAVVGLSYIRKRKQSLT
jgi:hypothetical protein